MQIGFAVVLELVLERQLVEMVPQQGELGRLIHVLSEACLMLVSKSLVDGDGFSIE